MRGLLADLRHAVRSLRRRPGYAALVVVTLALGLGVNTVAFSVVNALLFKPFRVPNADRIGWLFIGPPGNPLAQSSRDDVAALRRASQTLEQIVAVGRLPMGYDAAGETEQVWAQVASANYFTVVPAPMRAGRPIREADVAAAVAGPVPIVVSERFWRRRMQTGADLASFDIRLNRRAAAVIGVVRDGFQGPTGVFEPDLWVALEHLSALGYVGGHTAPDAAWLGLLAAPRPGVSALAIEGELRPVAIDSAKRAGRAESDLRVRFVWLSEGHPEARGALLWISGAAMGGVGVVLLIACFNVAGLVLSRSHERARELSVRAAIGASRWRLARHLLVENSVLAGVAGGAALLLSSWSGTILEKLSLPAPIPQRLHFQVDGVHLAVTALLVTIAAVVPALVPIWRLSRRDPIAALRVSAASVVGTRAQARTARLFVTAQVAGSTAFLVAALLLIQSFRANASADLGFHARPLAILDVDPVQHGYTTATAERLTADLVRRLEQDARVADVAIADRVPFSVGFPDTRRISLDGRDCASADCPTMTTFGVARSYFDAMGIPVRQGRLFREDAADAEAVLVNEAAALAIWPGQPAVGQRFLEGPARRARLVVGVVADVSVGMAGQPARPYFYRPFEREDFARRLSVIARSRTDGADAVPALREALRSLDPQLPPSSLQTMDERLALPMWPVTVAASFFTTCGILACTLVAVGLFGLTYYQVRQRLREFGVRLAIGAAPRDLSRLVLRDALRLLAPGLVLGVALAVGLTLLLRAQLVGISPLDPRVYLAAVVLQALVTMAASWSPARQASRVDPLTVLRGE